MRSFNLFVCILVLVIPPSPVSADASESLSMPESENPKPLAQTPHTDSKENELSVHHRTLNPFGVTFSFIGDPVFSVFGFNLNYNLNSFIRVIAGVGAWGDGDGGGGTTLGASVRVFHPDWNLSPFIGAGGSHMTHQYKSMPEPSTRQAFLGVGLDHQAKSGFNAGFVINIEVTDILFRNAVVGPPST
jgi:hypothetical protein